MDEEGSRNRLGARGPGRSRSWSPLRERGGEGAQTRAEAEDRARREELRLEFPGGHPGTGARTRDGVRRELAGARGLDGCRRLGEGGGLAARGGCRAQST